MSSSSSSIPEIREIKCIINRYTKVRGAPKLYKLYCALCTDLVIIYQKDGKGKLVRCYKDRIHYPIIEITALALTCQKCTQVIGIHMIYEPENRPAFLLNDGTYCLKEAK